MGPNQFSDLTLDEFQALPISATRSQSSPSPRLVCTSTTARSLLHLSIGAPRVQL